MSCGELFVNLGGGGSTPPNGMLQTAAALSSSLQVVKDNLGNSSALSLSTAAFKMSALTNDGTIVGSIFNSTKKVVEFSDRGAIFSYAFNGTNPTYSLGFYGAFDAGSLLLYGQGGANGVFLTGYPVDNYILNNLVIGNTSSSARLTIKGSGGSLASFRNSSNVEVVAIDNLGGITSNWAIVAGSGQGFRISGKIFLKSSADGIATITNNGEDDFSRFNLGGTTSSFPAIKRSGATIQIRLADDSGYAGFATGIGSALAFQVDKVSSTTAIGFFAASPVNQITTAVADAAYAAGGGGGSIIKTDDTIGGYTMGQVVQALFNYGLLRP